ncbi:nitronate monooxygenase [Malassezia cuniculi]|uniref:Nitronate monooxygenase n=1 Tax=Malassezia cuniculi TaxID=948313 RepID=A0AAF0JAZ2_9BASI|nr:nitronate monooxygenase [Malassezia cuniculi]
MAGAGGGELVGAVAGAGALGFIGAGYYSDADLAQQLALASAKAAPVDGRLPFGVGLLVWRLGMPGGPHTAFVDAVIEARPCAIWLSYGEQAATAAWIGYIRTRDSAIRIVSTANTLEEARVAVTAWRTDLLCVQGIEAGGHGLGSAPPRDALLSAVLAESANWDVKVPVIAAGGIATGANVAAVLVQGAAGAAVGTRFLVSDESLYSAAQKDLLVAARENDTVRSLAFDDARNTVGWPTGIDGRGLKSDTVADYDAAAARGALETEAEARRARYAAAAASGETERLITWSGTGIGSITSVLPAAEIVARLTADAASALADAAQLL